MTDSRLRKKELGEGSSAKEGSRGDSRSSVSLPSSALLSILLSILPVFFLGGCAGGPGPVFRHQATDALWMTAAADLGTQSLFRVQYQGPEGKVGLKLTLYLPARDQFRMDAADSLGRKVWSLAVEPGDRAVWLDHRQKLYCRVYAAGDQSFVPIAHLPLGALPRLVLGRMPATPSGPVAEGGGKISYQDDQGHTWNGRTEEGRLAWWTLLQEGEAVAWWRFADGESIFSDRRGGQQVRWRLQVQETMPEPLRPLEIPSSYREGACGHLGRR